MLNTVNLCQVSRRVGQHHGDLRAALISAALSFIEQADAEQVTLRAVARRAGVSAAAPYHHFPDKDALLAAVARDGFETLTLSQVEALSGGGTAQSRLEDMVKRYIAFAFEHKTHYDLMFRTPPDEVAGAEGQALRAAALASLAGLAEAIGDLNPELSAEKAGERALLGWALAHGAVDVGRWVMALRRPAADAVDAFAAEVAHAVANLALAQ